MAVENIGTYHLADNARLYEIQRTNNYEFIVTDIDGIMKAGYNGTEANAKIANAQEVLRLSVNKAAVPHFEQKAIEIKRGNTTLKYAGTPTFSAGSFAFHDFVGADTKAVLMAWQNLSYNVETELVGSVDPDPTKNTMVYKKNAYLVEYTPDYKKVRTWKLYGCWISALSEQGYSNDNDDKNLIDCTITYDYAKIDTSDDE